MLDRREFAFLLIFAAAVLLAFLWPTTDVERPSSLPATAGIENADPDTDITGVVVDSEGRPVGGALVTSDIHPFGRAPRYSAHWMQPEVEGPSTVTARDGTFLLDVGHGEIADLCVRPGRHGEAMACWRRPGDDLRIVVTDGADLVVDVTGPDRAPLADARVFVLGVLPYRAPMHFHSGVTNQAGRYRYPNLSAGNLAVCVVAEGLAMEEPVRMAVPPTGSVTGKVRMMAAPPPVPKPREYGYSRPDRVTDDEGRPIEGARVVYGDRQVYTDADGRIEFASHPPHPAGFSVWIPGRARAIIQPTPIHLGGTTRLRPGRTVTGRAGPDLAGAVVELERYPMTAEIAVVDARGTFRFADVGRGTWTLTLLHPDYDAVTRKVTIGPDRNPEPVDFTR